jgi:hypothetical protein
VPTARTAPLLRTQHRSSSILPHSLCRILRPRTSRPRPSPAASSPSRPLDPARPTPPALAHRAARPTAAAPPSLTPSTRTATRPSIARPASTGPSPTIRPGTRSTRGPRRQRRLRL